MGANQTKLIIGSSIWGDAKHESREWEGTFAFKRVGGRGWPTAPTLTFRTPSTACPDRWPGPLRRARCHTALRLPCDAAVAPSLRSPARWEGAPVGTEAALRSMHRRIPRH